MTIKPKLKTSSTMAFLNKLTQGKKLSLREFLQSIRLADEISLKAFAKTLGISASHLCDIEKGRKSVSLSRAIEFAEKLGHSKDQFVRLAIQDLIDEAGLSYSLHVQRVTVARSK